MIGARNTTLLFSEAEIAGRIEAIAAEIAALPARPFLVAPILVGGFVFAADLLRALARRGLSLQVEFLWLRSYAGAHEPQSEVNVRVGPGDLARDRHVLLLDGVLDHGHTLMKARDLLFEAGARTVTTAVAIDKRRSDALLAADFALFNDVKEFIVGYGMDDAGKERGLPHIAAVG
jgi:hypoxanthine phosphoribosyltransferase